MDRYLGRYVHQAQHRVYILLCTVHQSLGTRQTDKQAAGRQTLGFRQDLAGRRASKNSQHEKSST